MSAALGGARRDLDEWRELLVQAEAALPDAREISVTGYDPLEDLNRRGRWWSHRFSSDRLPDVLAFGVALAQAEVDGWEAGDPVVATRAFEDRRFLFSDRVVHWVLPLTFASDGAEGIRERMLALGDRLRPAPLLTGDEGLHPPGEDSYGPHDMRLAVDLGPADRWTDLALSHPGTARLWRDLAVRAGQIGQTASASKEHRDEHSDGNRAEESETDADESAVPLAGEPNHDPDHP